MPRVAIQKLPIRRIHRIAVGPIYRMADPGNRERGLKSALNNPRVSEQAKERDREILETEFGEHFEADYHNTESISHMGGISGSSTSASLRSSGSTGTRKSARMSSSSEIHGSAPVGSKPRSNSAGGLSSTATGLREEAQMEGKDVSNVIRGLKAAISNPNVSDIAKDRDRQKLRDLGESI